MKSYYNSPLRFFIIWWLFHICISGVCSLKIKNMTIPEAANVGDTIILSCDYDLESESLMFVDWYRDKHPFYRYMPKDLPHARYFPQPHLKVDISQSNETHVTLKDIEKETGGRYRCEVSTDAPNFRTVMRAATLVVADIPDKKPDLQIQGNKTIPETKFYADCPTLGLGPPLNITWIVDKNRIKIDHDVKLQMFVVMNDIQLGSENVKSKIIIQASQELSKSGSAKISCIATSYPQLNNTPKMSETMPREAPLPLTKNSNTDADNGSTTV